MGIWRWYRDGDDVDMTPKRHEVPEYEVDYIASQINSWVGNESELDALLADLRKSVVNKL